MESRGAALYGSGDAVSSMTHVRTNKKLEKLRMARVLESGLGGSETTVQPVTDI